jgi:hypothetical protein
VGTDNARAHPRYRALVVHINRRVGLDWSSPPYHRVERDVG